LTQLCDFSTTQKKESFLRQTLQSRVFRGRCDKSRQRRAATARKNVNVDKIRTLFFRQINEMKKKPSTNHRSVRLVARISHGDYLNKQQSIRFEQAITGKKKRS
jgi:hypothetical protein